jgi:NADH:ubiquinone oxidoreductase subunit K
MMIFPVFLMALAIGVVLAAFDNPYASDTARTERLTVLVLRIGAAAVAVCGALVMGDWLLG